uniref:B-block binding subunit of TFIIIC domain-containing protein n=1 Tax=Gadus morhua TaxID=8049 RepID=A0A8C5CTH7_GADMO
MDALSIVHDEVALEGLDGITIPSLWIRLGSRTPSFPLKLDSCTKEFIWRSLINNVDLDFYELPKERVDVELLDRFADINPDTGIQTTTSFSNAKNDVYPVTVVLDDKDGIQGSCLFYKQRKNVTKNVRTEELKQLVCLEEAVKRYGRKLVVVASQKMRFRVLIGEDSDPDLRITDQSYCILERLGRARWQGELQRDLHSSFRTEPGKLHYLRRCLDRHGLITMQSHVIRLPTGQQQHSILLLIKRYHVLRRSKYDILMEHLSNTLQDAPGQIASIITLRELLNVHERTFKHVYNYMLSYKLVQLITLPLEDLNPSAGPCNTKKGTKITVRCLKLLKPYQKKELMVEEDDDENEDGVGVSRKGLPQQDIIMERDLVLQAYHIVVSSGTKGISQSSLQVVMNVGKLEARMLCRSPLWWKLPVPQVRVSPDDTLCVVL